MNTMNDAWFYTEEWQAKEDLVTGRYEEFGSMDGFILSLDVLGRDWNTPEEDLAWADL